MFAENRGTGIAVRDGSVPWLSDHLPGGDPRGPGVDDGRKVRDGDRLISPLVLSSAYLRLLLQTPNPRGWRLFRRPPSWGGPGP